MKTPTKKAAKSKAAKPKKAKSLKKEKKPAAMKAAKKTTAQYVAIILTHCSRETRKRVIGKQCRPISDAAERGV